ncbi:NblA/ycf18 family protein [Microcoleus sp. F10-C6]|jgi:hypothetical protein|uniref:NblA/ycf18 family protein n=1 Tax=unclassified Microcoleus TaxID=2642155 RepID=UPI002FD7292C
MTTEKEEDGVQLQSLTELTIEQQFKLKVYADETQSLSAEEAQILLIQMARQNMIKDNVIRHLIGNQLEQA